MAGARVIATTRTAAKRDQLLALGAREVIVTNDNPEWPAAVREASDGAGADWTVATAGGETLEGCVSATRPGGALVLVGVRSGDTRARPGWNFSLRGVSVHSTRVGNRDHFEAMNRAIAANTLRPVIDRVFGFDEAVAAFDYFAAARHVGKVVIRH
jgi:NADPH:quinone reductase-like Zn-dependent oxidoreductase